MVSMNPESKITFVDAVVSGFRNARNIGGRASRAAFWYWILFLLLIRLVTSTVDVFIYPDDLLLGENTTDFAVMASDLATALQHSILSTTFAVEVLLLLPTVTLAIRRFRDGGWRPWLAVASFGGIYGSLAVSLVVATQLLSILTRAGNAGVDDAAVLGGFLVLVVALLVQVSSFIVIIIGALQPSRSESSS